MTRRAGIYLRISKDRTGEKLGVDRQLTDCLALAESQGWAVVDRYEDNDLSAYSGKARPQYLRMLGDLKDGRIDAVIAWHPDRLYRHPTDLEGFINAIDAARAAVKTCTAGDLDLSTGSGKMIARMLGAAARGEVDRTIERMHAKKAQQRANGEWQGGPRAFGYEPGMVAVRESERDELQHAARELIAGASPGAIAADWNARGVTTAAGRRWRADSVRRVLARPRNAGIVEHYGSEIGTGRWVPIFDEITYRGVRAVLGDGGPRRTYAPRATLLLSTVARCGYRLPDDTECGEYVIGAGRNESGRRYRCRTGKHVARLAAGLDPYVERQAVDLLMRPDAVDLVTNDREQAADLYARRDAIRARLDELSAMFTDGEIDRPQLRAGTERAKERLADVEASIGALTAGSALDGLAGRTDAGALWMDLSIERRRAAIDALMTITLVPSGRGGRGGTQFNPETVRIEPRRAI